MDSTNPGLSLCIINTLLLLIILYDNFMSIVCKQASQTHITKHSNMSLHKPLPMTQYYNMNTSFRQCPYLCFL